MSRDDTVGSELSRIGRAEKAALALDLRLDHALTIPAEVATEAAAAASVLARLAARHSLNPGWDAWHHAFLERYGPYAIVPLMDVLSRTSGLGLPAGYPGGATSPPAAAITDRDAVLLSLAQRAASRAHREIVLDDALISQLAPNAPAHVQTTTEVTVRVDSPSATALESGDFTLSISNVSRMAGTMTGRFLHLLDAEARAASWYAARPTTTPNALIVQISAPTRYTASENVTRTTQATTNVIALSEYREESERIPLSDIAVTADRDRIYLISLDRREVLEPVLLNAVDPVNHAHPIARFLAEATTALAAPCTAFDWGAAAKLPYLPALRHGRTTLSPARWTLTAPEMPGPDAEWSTWDKAFMIWGSEISLPRRVLLGDGDQRLTLDLDEDAHRALLRDQVDRSGRVSLRAAPRPEDSGWIGGYAHEIVIPMVSRRPQAPGPGWLRDGVATTTAFLPGDEDRISLKIYGHPDCQDGILTRYLPTLLSELPGVQWWFLRYQDPRPHLRLRLTGTAGAFATTALAVGAWGRTLHRAGLITDIQWDTYYPEAARYGGPEAIGTAEAYFSADSAATLSQITASQLGTGPDRRALTAASMTAIVMDFFDDPGGALRWLIDHTRTVPTPPDRALYKQAVALADPVDRTALIAAPGGQEIVGTWEARSSAATRYSDALPSSTPIARVLTDLLHLHHVRMIGADLDSEATCLHLARAAALSWITRTGKLL